MEAPPLDQRLELAAELLDSGHDGNPARIAEHTDGLPGHLVSNVQQGVEILDRSLPVPNALHDLGRPGRALAALRALRAALVREEACNSRYDRNHRLRVVDHYH